MSDTPTMAELILEHCQKTRADITSRPFTSALSQWLESLDELEDIAWKALQEREK
jgi:hypothetical protein